MSTKTIWAVTGILAILILAGAVYVTQTGTSVTPVTPSAPPVPVAMEPVPVTAPETGGPGSEIAEVPEEPADVAGEAGEDVSEDFSGTDKPRILLDNIAGTLKISSRVISPKMRLPLTYSCYRDNISPPLSWEGAPPETKSFVIILEKYGLENPFASWLLFNIPGDKMSLNKNLSTAAEIDGVMRHATSDHSNTGYIGPCEPQGKIKYAFRLFALDRVLSVPAGVDKYTLIRAMNGHIIDTAELPFLHYLRF